MPINTAWTGFQSLQPKSLPDVATRPSTFRGQSFQRNFPFHTGHPAWQWPSPYGPADLGRGQYCSLVTRTGRRWLISILHGSANGYYPWPVSIPNGPARDGFNPYHMGQPIPITSFRTKWTSRRWFISILNGPAGDGFYPFHMVRLMGTTHDQFPYQMERPEMVSIHTTRVGQWVPPMTSFHTKWVSEYLHDFSDAPRSCNYCVILITWLYDKLEAYPLELWFL